MIVPGPKLTENCLNEAMLPMLNTTWGEGLKAIAPSHLCFIVLGVVWCFEPEFQDRVVYALVERFASLGN